MPNGKTYQNLGGFEIVEDIANESKACDKEYSKENDILFGDDLTDFSYGIEIDQVAINLVRDIPQNNISCP